jgi:hypothetical protein
MWLGEWGRVSGCLYSHRCGHMEEGEVGAGISRTCEIPPAFAAAFESSFEPALFESKARMHARMHAGRQARRHQRPRGRWEQVKTSLTHLHHLTRLQSTFVRCLFEVYAAVYSVDTFR